MDAVKPIGLLFAGQGAQTPGMGLTTLSESPDLEAYFSSLQNHVDFDVKEVLVGNDDRLQQTRFTQPAIAVTSLLLFRQLQHHLPFKFNGVAGFSLGEWTALVASGIADEATMLRLLSVRAKAMDEAARLNPGKMAAMIGATDEQLHALIEATKQEDVLTIVNYNCPGQRVLSGSQEAIERAVAQASAFGVRRAVILSVSGAFHSPLMVTAKEPLATALKKANLNPPIVPQWLNRTAQPASFDDLVLQLTEQVASPVLFEASLRHMIEQGMRTFIEIGPGSVLSGFVKKIDASVQVVSYNGLHDIEAVKEVLQ